MHRAAVLLSHTPLWAFALLAYLIWQGVASFDVRTVPVWRALVVPSMFIALGLSRLLLGHDAGPVAYAPWLCGAVTFAPLPLLAGPRLLATDRNAGRVTRPGSKLPLIRNVSVFFSQYAVAVATATHGHQLALVAGHAVSGATAGYFAGWVFVFLRRYGQDEASPHDLVSLARQEEPEPPIGAA